MHMSNRDFEEDERTRVVPSRSADDEALRVEGDLDSLDTQILGKRVNNPVARLVVIEGPGVGNARPVYPGTNSIGRERKNRIPLDFGDDTISRMGHAVIVFDDRNGLFRIFDGGKLNPVHVNSVMVSGERDLAIGDVIEVGSTMLRLEAL
jgi:hypothetical protein